MLLVLPEEGYLATQYQTNIWFKKYNDIQTNAKSRLLAPFFDVLGIQRCVVVEMVDQTRENATSMNTDSSKKRDNGGNRVGSDAYYQ